MNKITHYRRCAAGTSYRQYSHSRCLMYSWGQKSSLWKPCIVRLYQFPCILTREL